ncbi:hypothetical protein B0H21DRAFT_700759 [Amylocystis lapponica]|nr:hypothetical protein B0H21DRAFT_700759 [Amylocystis lapponica]
MPILEDLTESPSPSRSSSARPHSYSRISLPSASSSQAAPATPPKDDSPTQTVEPLSAYTCPICFSPPTYATLTPCGHICCGECLFTAIKTTMERAAHSAVPLSERNTARCPVCRASIPGWNGKGGGVIGLKPRAVLTL